MFCGWDFYIRRLTAQSSMSSNYTSIASIFLKFGEVIVEYCVYKRVLDFPQFCFYDLFMKLFLFQSKTKPEVKGIIQNFTSNKLKKKFEHPFAKKLIYEHVMPQLISSDILKREWIFWMGKKKFWMRSWSSRK